MRRKGQAATEYMIILAVVIIIALIVVGVMGGIPGIGAGAKSKTSSAYWSQADVAIVAYSLSAASAVTDTLRIRNNLRNTISITQVNYSTTASGNPTTSFSAATTVIAPGQTATLTGSIAVDTCDATAEAGNNWATNIVIKYSDTETGATYYFRGDGNKLEGVCAN